LDGCLKYNTPISTPSGPVNIENLKIGQEIFSYDTSDNSIVVDQVNGVLVREDLDNWYEVNFDDGTSITVTDNHYFWIENLQCYRMLKDFTGNEILMKLQ
jgi:hypothetical protein